VKPSIDVIITTYNRPEFLGEAATSVANQTYPNINIIIIDDGSELNNSLIISKLAAKYNRRIYYVYQRHTGISCARNTGIKSSASEYIAFLDDDDLWHKDKLTKQIRALQTMPEFDACYTSEKWLRNGKHLNQCKKHAKFSGDIFEKTLPLCIISPSSILLKRRIFDKIGLFDEDFTVCEDYELWLRLALNYRILLVDEPLIIKRGGHQNQLSKKYPAMDKFRVAALLKLIKTNKLPADKMNSTVNELLKKCRIIASGCLKRRNYNEYEYYKKIIADYEISSI